MDKYIGVKIIHAEPVIKGEFEKQRGVTIPHNDGYYDKGYKVEYEDGYVSYSPKLVFEKAYRKIGSLENTITQQNVDDFIIKVESLQMGDKTTVVKATLANGFIIVESSSCVDVKNFDMKIGIEICLEKIKDKVWFLLGFLLQCGDKGLNN
jgi:hypothetical protein